MQPAGAHSLDIRLGEQQLYARLPGELLQGRAERLSADIVNLSAAVRSGRAGLCPGGTARYASNAQEDGRCEGATPIRTARLQMAHATLPSQWSFNPL